MTRTQALAEIADLKEQLTEAWEALGCPRIVLKARGEPAVVIVPAGWHERAAVALALSDAGLEG